MKTLSDYIKNPNYFGCIVGRNAGRIQNSEILLDGKIVTLSKNFLDKHQLHSGYQGFQFQYFEAIINKHQITFLATSQDNEDGFPGNITLKVIYRLVKNELQINYEAVSDQETIINMTNHAYFNLSVDKTQSVENHLLQINAKKYLELDSEMIPKSVSDVAETPFDFRNTKLIGKDIDKDNTQLKIANGYDHPFLINKENKLNPVASLSLNKTTLEVYTNQDALVLYTGNFLDSTSMIENHKTANYRCAVCLETQGIPNSGNLAPFKQKNIYHKGSIYTQTTIWKIISK